MIQNRILSEINFKVIFMETLQIPPQLRENFIDTCRQLQLDANRVLEQFMARFVSQPPKQSIEAWVQNILGDLRLSGNDEFVEELTVDEYFSMTEKQRDALWEKWEQEADHAVGRMTARKVVVDASSAG
jgi:hypothetical protein